MKSLGLIIFCCCLVTVSGFHDIFGFGGLGGGRGRKSNRGWSPFDIFDNFGFNFPNTKLNMYNMNDIPAGTQKVIRDGNGQGVVFRSKNGNAGGFTFSSGNGGSMSFGGTFGPGNSEGDWIYSTSVNGRPGKVVSGSGRPVFTGRKQDKFMNEFMREFFRLYKKL